MELFYFKNDICSLYISLLLYMVLSYVIILFEFDTMWLPFDQKIHITHKKKKHHHRQVTHHVSIPKLVLPDPKTEVLGSWHQRQSPVWNVVTYRPRAPWGVSSGIVLDDLFFSFHLGHIGRWLQTKIT